MIEIVFWVLMVLYVVLGPQWPGAPWPAWSGNIILFLLFLCLGIAVFGLGVSPRGVGVLR